MSTAQEEISLDELSSIMNLQRQEAFDDTTEALHRSLSRRGTLTRKAMGSSAVLNETPEQQNAEEKLLQIITNQTTSTPSGLPRRSSVPSEKSARLSPPNPKKPAVGSISGSTPVAPSPSRRDRRGSSSRPRPSSRQRSTRNVSEPNLDNYVKTPERVNGSGDTSQVSSASRREKRSSSRQRPVSRGRKARNSSEPDFSHPNAQERATTPRRRSDTKRQNSEVNLVGRTPPAAAQASFSASSPNLGMIGPNDAIFTEKPLRRRERRDSSRTRRPQTTTNAQTRSSSRSRRNSRTTEEADPSGESVSSGEARNSTNGQRAPARSSFRRSSSRGGIQKSDKEGGSDGSGGEREQTLKSTRQQARESQQSASRRSEGDLPVTNGGKDKSFEKLWGEGGDGVAPITEKAPREGASGPPKGGLGGFLDNERPRRASDLEMKSLSGVSKAVTTIGSGGDGRLKKTKLEKIHELQSKCDRYKLEWIDATKEKKQLRQEVQNHSNEIVALAKQIETSQTETSILQKNLAEALQKVDSIEDEQRKERTEFSNAAKELAQARIDHAKALNDAREARADLDQHETSMREKDRRLTELEEELKKSKQRADELDADVNFAEEAILKLEDDLKTTEEELVKYRTAAAQSEADGNSEHLRKVRDDVEQQMHEERERRLEEKQQKLDEKYRQLEEEQERFQEKEKEREYELAERKRHETEDNRMKDEERHRMDDEINERLRTLEDDNTVLQGRLKSEQLESNVKLREKEGSIAKLEAVVSELKQQLREQEGDPNGLAALQQELESSKVALERAKEDLEEAQQHNTMLVEGVEELQSGSKELSDEITGLQKELVTLKKETENWKRKSEEWEAKSGEWTNKAHQWKEKADHWEKVAKEAAPEESAPAPAPAADPQALFLQAAFEKKKALNANQNPGSWGMIGNFLGGRTTSEEESEALERVKELEAENARQADIIKSLRSEMVKMQAQYKDAAYSSQRKLQEVEKEREAVEMKNTSLMKELELARKLEQFAAQG